MTQEMQTAIERLRALPEMEQRQLAPRINEYLSKLEGMRQLVREGLDDVERGDVLRFDAEDVIRRGEGRLARRERVE